MEILAIFSIIVSTFLFFETPDNNAIKEAYCTKYTHGVQEYKACKASNLVEFIEKGGGK